MARKVFVEVKFQLVINLDEDITVDDVLNEMDYEFTAPTDVNATIENSEMLELPIQNKFGSIKNNPIFVSIK